MSSPNEQPTVTSPPQLRSVLVAGMVASQLGLAVVAVVQGNFREAAITTLLAVTNALIFWR